MVQQPHGVVCKSSVGVNNWVGNLLPATTMSTMVSGDNAASHVDQNHNNHKRTTLVMFLITMMFIMSWTIFWVVKATATNDTDLGRVVLYLARTLYLIDCVTNPVFYMSLSSKFRKTTVNVFLKFSQYRQARCPLNTCFWLAVHGKPVLFWKGISGLKFPCFLFYAC